MSPEIAGIRELHDHMSDLVQRQGVVIITAKAPPMTEEELERAARTPMFVDYIGMLK